MSPIIQTMKNQQPTRTRGGARPNSGPKPNIEKNLILYDIALSFNVGLDRARRLLAEWRNQPELVIGEKRCRNLRKWAGSKDAELYLNIHREHYLKRRKKWGFRS
jgi:hypothetical protein